MDTLYILQLSFFEITLLSPHVREFGFRNPGNFCLWKPESWIILLRNPGSQVAEKRKNHVKLSRNSNQNLVTLPFT